MRASGVVSLDDMAGALALQAADAAWEFDTLLDLTGASSSAIRFNEAQKLVALIRQMIATHAMPGRVAVAAHSDVLYGLARMVEIAISTLGQPIQTFVGRSVEDADAWLGQPQPRR